MNKTFNHLAIFSARGRSFAVLIFCLFIFTPVLSVSETATPPLSSLQSDNKPHKAPVILAHTWDGEKDITGWWMSEKLDGVRGYWTGKEFISRSGNPFHAPKWFIRNFPAVPLDGELWIGRQQFSEVVSIVRRKSPDAQWENVHYFIFDAPQVAGGFEERLAFVQIWFQNHPSPYAKVLEQELCESEAHLQKKLTEIESRGGEGLMLRRPNSPYTIGRSYDLLKVKRFKDAEATAIKHLPGSGKHEGRLGALLVRLPNGIQFAIGTGFSDKERENPPPVGSIVTFKYQGFTKNGVPRFASFLRIREAL